MVDVLVNRERHGGVGTINARAAGINKMFNSIVAASFKNVSKPNNIAVNVSQRILDRIPHPRLCRQVDHSFWLVLRETVVSCLAVREVDAQMRVVRMSNKTCQTGFFESGIVIIVVIVNANHAISTSQKAHHQRRAYKTSCAGNQYFHRFSRPLWTGKVIARPRQSGYRLEQIRPVGNATINESGDNAHGLV